MTEFIQRIANLSKNQLMALAIKLEKQANATVQSSTESIAIVGAACRFPGEVYDLTTYWEMLASGTLTVKNMEQKRWDMNLFYDSNPETPGKTHSKAAALIENVDLFDADFFGIAPREAESMDPQQRLLLEVAWEAIESGGYSPDSLLESNTGVFIGMMNTDYNHLNMNNIIGEQAIHSPYFASGEAFSIAAGRIAYILGLHGPCITLDTACSSSLVAIHQACQSLRSKECDMALAGGVSLILSPTSFIKSSNARMLSPTGRCWTFDSRADGYARGEGCGLVFLKRLNDAYADKDPILAVIRATAINQDGRGQGLTAPNGHAQCELMLSALKNSGVSATDVAYIDAHGTGTPLGDPIEITAISEVYGVHHSPDDPLIVGSAKTNLGHTESAAGIAGLLKLLLCVNKGIIPPHINFERLNPNIDLKNQIHIPINLQPWPPGKLKRLGALNSFGFSGTNAHAILEEPPIRQSVDFASFPWQIFVLSAKSSEALKDLISKFKNYLSKEKSLNISDVCYTLGVGRSHFKYRYATVCQTMPGLVNELTIAEQNDCSNLTSTQRAKIAMLFTGQGSQYSGMGKTLYENNHTFKACIDRCEQLINKHLEFTVTSLLWGEHSQHINNTKYTQPCIFALQYSLYHFWRSLGIKPAIVIGHSIGEIALACVANIFSLEDAVDLVCTRSILMDQLINPGKMCVLLTDRHTVEELIAEHQGKISIAAINGPQNTVISGISHEVDLIQNKAQKLSINCIELSVSHAFHSTMMEPMLEKFSQLISKIKFNKPTLEIISSKTGKKISDDMCNFSYWVDHIKDPVKFYDAVTSMQAENITSIIELGPQSTLLGMVTKCIDTSNIKLIPSISQMEPWQRLMRSISEIYQLGIQVDWVKLYQEKSLLRLNLPTYAFQRKHFWINNQAIINDSNQNVNLSKNNQRFKLVWNKAELLTKSQEYDYYVVFIKSNKYRHDLQLSSSFKNKNLIFVEAGKDNLRIEDNYFIVGDSYQDIEILFNIFIKVFKNKKIALLYLWSLDEEEQINHDVNILYQSTIKQTQSMFQLAKYLVVKELQCSLTMLIVTVNSAVVREEQKIVSLNTSPLIGMLRTLSIEQPQINWKWLDVDDVTQRTRNALFQIVENEISTETSESQIAYHQGQRFVARLESVTTQAISQDNLKLNNNKLYIISGGLGNLGIITAGWLIEHGVRHLLLLSRSGIPSEFAKNKIEHWRSQDIKITILKVNLNENNISSLDQLLSKSEQTLGGIIHAAGLLEDATISQLDWSRFESVLKPKINGVLNLHQLSLTYNPDHFIIFSSIASIIGSGGQTNYSAANAFLDNFAYYRHSQSLPATVINWGPWANSDMTSNNKVKQKLMQSGLHLLDEKTAIESLNQIVLENKIAEIVALFNWPQVKLYLSDKNSSLYSNFINQEEIIVSNNKGAWRLEYQNLNQKQRIIFLKSLLINKAKMVLLLDEKYKLNEEQSLVEIGLDSLVSVELRNKIATELDLMLPISLMFDYPNITVLTEYLNKKLTEELGEPDPEIKTLTINQTNVIASEIDENIAIIGMSCRAPGNVNNQTDFFELLVNGKSGIVEIEGGRWSNQRCYSKDSDDIGKMNCSTAGLIDNPELFDNEFFGISATEAMNMDPQQRIILEVSWEAIESAGYKPSELGLHAGIFIGPGPSDFADLRQRNVKVLNGYMGTGHHLSVIAGRIAYILNWRGPCMAIDTACSSSLVALHLACESLKRNESNVALAGGVNIILSPVNNIILSKAKMLSPSGQCNTFDDNADGYVRSEGCGVVLLKRLSDALRDKDNILGIIKASAVNQDGRSQGLTAPNGPAQEAVMKLALEKAKISPAEIDYVETHGTGTKLGDPIEVNALLQVYGAAHNMDVPLYIGSLKTNIGHAESAGGILGVIKVLLSFQHECIFSHLNLNKINPHLGITDNKAIIIPKENIPWKHRAKKTRKAAVSSFGFSGTNVHVILEEAPKDTVELKPNIPKDTLNILTISAKSKAALENLIERYIEFVNKGLDISLSDLCFAANTGREQFDFSIAIVAESLSELKELLTIKHQQLKETRTLKLKSADVYELSYYFTDGFDFSTAYIMHLYEESPAFKKIIDKADDILKDKLSSSMSELITNTQNLNRSTINLVNIVYQVALGNLLQSLGLEPITYFCSGFGEISVAIILDILSLEQTIDWLLAKQPINIYDIIPRDILDQKCHTFQDKVVVINRKDTQPTHLCFKRVINHQDASQQLRAGALYIGIQPACDSKLPYVASKKMLLNSLSNLFNIGTKIDWKNLYSMGKVKHVALPTYPFQHKDYSFKTQALNEFNIEALLKKAEFFVNDEFKESHIETEESL